MESITIKFPLIHLLIISESVTEAIFKSPIANLFIIAGIIFMAIAVVGNIKGKIEPGKTGRIVAGILGFILVVSGLIMYFISNKSPETNGINRSDPVVLDSTKPLMGGSTSQAGQKTVLNDNSDLVEPTALHYKHKGDSAFSLGKFHSAIEDYSNAIKLNAHYADAFCGRGLSYYNIKELDMSFKDLNIAISLNVDYYLAFDTRGRIHFERKEFDQAIADFTEAIRLNPKFAHAYDARAYCYWNQSEYNLAIDDFGKVLEYSHDAALRSRAEKNIKILGTNP